MNDVLFTNPDRPGDIEFVEYQRAYDEWMEALKEHDNGKCAASLTGEHCMVCEHRYGDPHYVWRRLMIVVREPMGEPSG